MKDSTIIAIILGMILAMGFGVLIGYAVARDYMQDQAVSNHHGHYELVDGYKQFGWGTDER